VLDNCEHVIDEAARLVEAVTSVATGVRFVATTREVLAIRVEQVLRLGPLGVPDAGDPPERQLASPSIRLFVERARAVRPDVVASGPALRTIVEICRRLDGIPLAIELAAARTALFDVAELPLRMDDLLRLLAHKRRDLAPRQQTLEALVDWSYRLLGERDRIVFERLSVFTGRFDVAAAASVCASSERDVFDVEDALESLVQKSFVAVDGEAAERRLRIYETIRQFAERRLGAAELGAETTFERHAEYYARIAASASDERSEDLNAFGADLANIRSAFRRACSRPALATTGARLGLAIGRYSLEVGALAEGESALEAARALPGIDDASLAWIDFLLAQYAWLHRRHDAARAGYERVAAANIATLAGRPEWGIAALDLGLGNFEAASVSIDRSIAALEVGTPTFALFQAYTERVRIELALGRARGARRSAEQALEAASGHDRARAIALGNLATLTFHAGELDAAAKLIDDAIVATERTGARRSVPYYLCVRSEVALLRGDPRALDDALATLSLAIEVESTELAARAAETLGAIWGMGGRTECAATLMSWADESRVAAKLVVDDDDRAVIERKRTFASWSGESANGSATGTPGMSLGALLEFVTMEIAK